MFLSAFQINENYEPPKSFPTCQDYNYVLDHHSRVVAALRRLPSGSHIPTIMMIEFECVRAEDLAMYNFRSIAQRTIPDFQHARILLSCTHTNDYGLKKSRTFDYIYSQRQSISSFTMILVFPTIMS